MPVRLLMTSCQSSSDVISIHGVDKDLLLVFRHLDLKEGQMEAFKSDPAGALVGEKISNRYGWKMGQNVTVPELANVSFNVRGIMRARGSPDDFLIYTGRRFLQEAEQQQGQSHYVLVKAKPGTDSTKLCRDIEGLPLTVQIQSQSEEAQLVTVLDQLSDLVRVSRFVIIIIVAVVLIAVGNAISMATRDRYREFGIMRTLGFPKGAVVGMVLGEGIFLGLAGALLGCLVVQSLAWAHLVKSVATCAITVDFSVTPTEWIKAVAAVAAAAVAGSILPALSAARLDIVQALKPEE